MKFVITGFGPFPGVPENPAAIVAEKTANILKSKGYYVEFHSLKVSIDGCNSFYEKLTGKDIFVLHIGVYTELKKPEIELVGQNIANFGVPDADGNVLHNQKIDKNLKLGEKIQNPVDFQKLIPNEVDFGYSRDAGQYICNYIYFLALQNINKKTKGAVFVHIPAFSSYPEETCVSNMVKFSEGIINNCNTFGIKK
ncbi:Clan CF, family C15, pyroglutamyl peptidase I-like cysteine peptidase [Trichomonas vaginalis G3]|uniref:Clan CF, family C15, pyroglutamyl peptidase I-like cysteine peptidase n=1 Tax=Trichomonas vaginalis (strain ATCC PRA-98 / G3) TaxID=412133 RepID=A2EQH9_TRIV3|nr:Clan CF, family C15, pyroglutamyl peptidase I-like cysteine peptidase [Trichomonas vaginalis G3]EAY05121.1 Clan CF, family C15, pyroglutamyl peptidase I-like cysteine peptidase [Trichomonas vaginalis G3]KAI5551452.1 Clan CF, family C15, pyroglutamyl peptidase I-like cysteine peptidase [Trichomonas vaginalis G3]|eukprot:XP_001317344.1 Clan CF, family C15, pyroglutamyl peptidase I-like cysteine peptidase [Trichomonas vaginalis G3]